MNLPAKDIHIPIRQRCEKKAKRTKIDKIAFEVLHKLVLVECNDAYVPSIAAVVKIVGDLGCPIEIPDDSLVGIAPGGVEQLEEVGQDTNVHLHSLQVLSFPLHGQPVVLGLLVLRCRFRQEVLKLLSELLSVTELPSNQRARLVNDLLEPTTIAITDELLRCTRPPTILVIARRVLGRYVLIRDRHNPRALLVLPVLALVEVNTEGALRILPGQLLRGERNAQDSRQSAADPVSRVCVPDDTHHGRRTSKPLDSTFNPVNGDVLDTMFGENGEDGGVGIAAASLLGSIGMDRDPENNVVVQDVLAVFVGSGEADRQHRRDANTTTRILEQRDNLRSNRLLPKLVLEDRVEHPVSGLLGDGEEPISRDDKGTLSDIGTVEERGRVIRDAGVEMSTLEDRDEVISGGCRLGVVQLMRSIAGRGRGWGHIRIRIIS